MPIHNWEKAPVGLYHHFHQSWAVNLAEGLNAGVLPAGFFALVDQRAIGLIPDVLALKKLPGRKPPPRRRAAGWRSPTPRRGSATSPDSPTTRSTPPAPTASRSATRSARW